MTIITVDDMRQNLVAYLDRVKAGETLLIVEADQPVAEIKPVESGEADLQPYALCAGEFQVPVDFDVPLPAELVASFEGQ
jgi:antitoxin (DNA-binding transcriptional repressor) of toxin-antitoxin stability system